MSMRVIVHAGVVPVGAITFGSSATADWQAVGGDLSGDWSNTAHWSTGLVPGIDDTVLISDDGSATSAWTVTETDESASALTLTMNLGTLQAAGGLTVANNLVQNSGTLFAEALAGVSVGGSLVQAGGALVLDDDGESFTPFSSSGTDTVDGQVTLVNGANWTDLGLDIGTGLAGGTSEVGAGFTLEGGVAPGQLVVALGPLQIGADPGSASAGGSGTLVADKGSGVTADSLALLNHSVVSVDGQSFVVIGAAASSDAGAVAIEGGAGVLADIATFDAGVVNDGTLGVVAWQGEDTTAPGDVLIAGTLVSGDAVTVAAQATLTVGGGIDVTGGSLAVGSGGTLVANQAANSFGVALVGGALTLDGGTLASQGSVDFANSNATLLDGARWTTGSLEVGPGYGNATRVDATLALSGASALVDAGGLFIGNDPTSGTNAVGGVGAILLSGSSTLLAGTGMQLSNGSLLSLDPTSGLVLGAASVDPGAVAIGPGRVVFTDIATIDANVFDAGALQVDTANGTSGVVPGDVQVSGSLTGAGKVFVSGRLSLGDASGFTGTIGIGGGGELVLAAGELANGLILPGSSAAGGSITIDVAAQPFDAGGFSPTYSQSTGLLVFGDAGGQSTLDLGPGRTLGDFSLRADGGGTLITLAVPCFATGSRILTRRGEVAVEALCVGDVVATAGGGCAPVVWIGHRRVDCRRHGTPESVWPVRVAAGAFGAGVPHDDLWLSPDHAVLVDDVLIPVRYLVNAASIAQEPVDSVVYWHVELARHEVILAEGLPCESYLDTGNRAAFAGAPGARARLEPTAAGAGT